MAVDRKREEETKSKKKYKYKEIYRNKKQNIKKLPTPGQIKTKVGTCDV